MNKLKISKEEFYMMYNNIQKVREIADEIEDCLHIEIYESIFGEIFDYMIKNFSISVFGEETKDGIDIIQDCLWDEALWFFTDETQGEQIIFSKENLYEGLKYWWEEEDE